MTTIIVEMLAFMEGETRFVNIPDDEWNNAQGVIPKLELVYHYGQNDFQPVKDRCSVSAGDVVKLFGKCYKTCFYGWKELSVEDYAKYLSIPRRERCFAFNNE
jgi:hypothetical protein